MWKFEEVGSQSLFSVLLSEYGGEAQEKASVTISPPIYHHLLAISIFHCFDSSLTLL